VFESQLVPGGLLVNGVPSFKVENTWVWRRSEWIKRRGVEFRLGVKIGEDLSLLAQAVCDARRAADSIHAFLSDRQPKRPVRVAPARNGIA
jgi:glutamate synthase (NADPH/NADH) small chain